MRLMLHMLHLFFQRVAVHSLFYLHTAELGPRRGDKSGSRVELSEKLACGKDLALRGGVGAAHDDKVCICDLVVEELAEVAHIHAALARVNNSDLCTDGRSLDLFNGARNVGQLAHAGRLDYYPVGLIFIHDLLQRLFKVANESAADAAGVHLRYLNTGIPEEAAVDRNLTELILNEDKLLALICLRNELADKRRLTGAKETGKYIYSCHNDPSKCVF